MKMISLDAYKNKKFQPIIEPRETYTNVSSFHYYTLINKLISNFKIFTYSTYYYTVEGEFSVFIGTVLTLFLTFLD